MSPTWAGARRKTWATARGIGTTAYRPGTGAARAMSTAAATSSAQAWSLNCSPGAALTGIKEELLDQIASGDRPPRKFKRPDHKRSNIYRAASAPPSADRQDVATICAHLGDGYRRREGGLQISQPPPLAEAGRRHVSHSDHAAD